MFGDLSLTKYQKKHYPFQFKSYVLLNDINDLEPLQQQIFWRDKFM